MPIYIDSAIISEVEEASRWGWIKGLTTNPTLLEKSNLTPEDTLRRLAELINGPIFYQLTSEFIEDMMAEAKRARTILKDKLVLKIPATETGFTIAASLKDEMDCAITAIYSPAQAIIAEAAGAKYAIIYYNRAMRLLEYGETFVKQVVDILGGSKTMVLAASFKSTDEVVHARHLGIEYFTIPFAVLKAMPVNELSNETVKTFNASGTGI